MHQIIKTVKYLGAAALSAALLDVSRVLGLGTVQRWSDKLNVDGSDAVNTDGITGNPIRQGTFEIASPPEDWRPPTGEGNFFTSIIEPVSIKNYADVQSATLGFFANLITYALGLLALIALIYLIYHGFLMVTAAGSDEQYNRGLKGIKYAAIAIVGIGVSWFVVSFIFGVIDNVITAGTN